MTVSQRAQDVLGRRGEAIPGYWMTKDSHDKTGGGVNSSPQRQEVRSLNVVTPTNGATYTFDLNGITLTYIEPAAPAATATTVATGIALLINEDILVRGQVTADSVAGLVTITANTPGLTTTLSTADAKITAALVTAALLADPIEFGRAVIDQGYRLDEASKLVALAIGTNFAPQVHTITLGNAGGATLTAALYEVRDGERFLLAQVSGADAGSGAGNATLLLGLLNTVLPAATVVATSAGADLILTSEVSGLEFAAEVSSSGALVAVAPANTSGPDKTTSFTRAFAGISLYTTREEATQIPAETASYRGNQGVRYATRGSLWVTSLETVDEGDTVYVELAAGADAGKFYATDSATRLALPRRAASWIRNPVAAGEDAAAILVGVR